MTLSRDRAAELLGVSLEAGAEEIEAAWRETAKRHHPDVGGDPEVFYEAGEAYTVLRASGSAFEVVTEDGETVPEARPAVAPETVEGRPVWRFLWRPMVGGSVTVAGIVMVVLVLAPAGSAMAGPVIMVAAVWIAGRWWLAAGKPMPPKVDLRGVATASWDAAQRWRERRAADEPAADDDGQEIIRIGERSGW